MVKGKSIREIARDLKVSRNTDRKVLAIGGDVVLVSTRGATAPKIGRWKAELDGLLAKNAVATGRERLTLIRLFEELRGAGL